MTADPGRKVLSGKIFRRKTRPLREPWVYGMIQSVGQLPFPRIPIRVRNCEGFTSPPSEPLRSPHMHP